MANSAVTATTVVKRQWVRILIFQARLLSSLWTFEYQKSMLVWFTILCDNLVFSDRSYTEEWKRNVKLLRTFPH